ncbi:MAG TPA: hypothetical protein VGE25_15210 [Sediminibacterium sp.]
MKKLSFLLGLLALTISSFAADVNETVLKVFSKTYPDAQSISWSVQTNGYLVYFTKKDVSYRVMYDQEGSVTLSFKYYGEENLSPLVLNRVKKSYPDYKIHSVIEKSSDTNVEYHVILEGTKKLITLKSDPTGNLEVVSKYDRGE